MTQTTTELISALADRLRAQGADPHLLAELQRHSHTAGVAEMDAAIARIGQLLVDRGHADLWRDVYIAAYQREDGYQTAEEMEFLRSGVVD